MRILLILFMFGCAGHRQIKDVPLGTPRSEVVREYGIPTAVDNCTGYWLYDSVAVDFDSNLVVSNVCMVYY